MAAGSDAASDAASDAVGCAGGVVALGDGAGCVSVVAAGASVGSAGVVLGTAWVPLGEVEAAGLVDVGVAPVVGAVPGTGPGVTAPGAASSARTWSW